MSQTDKKQLYTYLVAAACMAAATSMHDSIFNNFLSDTFNISPAARGFLELPRELPGFMVVFMAGALYMLTVPHVGLVGTLVFAAGMSGMALMGDSYYPMMAAMMVGSAGMHLLQPVGSSISISLSSHTNRGKRLGQVGVIETIGSVLGALFIMLVYTHATPPYEFGFACAGVLGLVAALYYSRLKLPALEKKRTKLLLKRQFWLYYLLEFLFGARKQIFITFGPWVLIKVFGIPVSTMAILQIIWSLIGIGFKPLVGMAIDRFGERTIMIIDGLVLSVVCLGYGYAATVFHDKELAKTIVCACLIADNMLFALGTARPIYLSRMTSSPQELTSTLSMGITINHVVSMTIPFVAGKIWNALGYERLFAFAAGLALLLALTSTMAPRRSEQLLLNKNQ